MLGFLSTFMDYVKDKCGKKYFWATIASINEIAKTLCIGAGF